MAFFKKRGEKELHPHMQSKLNISTEGLSEEEISKLEAEAVLQKFDKESAYRNHLTGVPAILISAVLILFALFQLYTSIFFIATRIF